jgi:ABC-type xylose transport system permease subunit
MSTKTSQHILNTSANLLGFCLVVITSLHITNEAQSSYIDEWASVVAALLIVSCFFSFFSIRSQSLAKQHKFEKIADYFFIFSLVGILLIILFLAFNFMH